MGNKRLYEALDGYPDGRPTFDELLRAARNPQHRRDARKLIEMFDLAPKSERALCSALCEIQRWEKEDPKVRAHQRAVEPRNARWRALADGLDEVLSQVSMSRADAARVEWTQGFLRFVAGPSRPAAKRGRPRRPWLAQARANLRSLHLVDREGHDVSMDNDDDVRVLLRGIGIPLSEGRPEK